MKKIQHLIIIFTLLLMSFTLNAEANQNCQTGDCAMIKEQMTNKIQQIYKQLTVIAKENNIDKDTILNKLNSCNAKDSNETMTQKMQKIIAMLPVVKTMQNQNCKTGDCTLIKDKMVDKVEVLWTQFSTLAKENNISKEMILSKFDSCGSNETNKELVQKGTSFCSDMFVTMFELPLNVFQKLTEDTTVLSVDGK